MPPARVVLWLVLGTAMARLGLASGTGLGIDESYMVAAGRTLQLSYFDHPPISWWLARLAALAAGSEAPVIVRLPFVALFAASTWLMFALTSRLFGARAGMWAAVGLNLSPVFGVTTATWVLPDGPLVCALLAAAYCLVRAVEARPSPQPSPEAGRGSSKRRLAPSPALAGEGWGEGLASWVWWLLAGLCAGLALLSKYSAALILLGAFAYFLTQPAHRRWLARPQPYAAAILALLCCTPVLVWNARHGWASLAFQGDRAAAAHWQPFGPLATLGGEALFVGPWIWLPMMGAWLGALRAGPGAWRSWLPACLGAAPVLLFVVVSAWARHVLFHWAAPGYLMFFPLLGAWAARADPRLVRAGWQAGAALVGIGCALLLVEVRVNLLAPFGVDPGVQETDWTALRQQLAARGLLHRADTVIAGTNWHETGKLDYALGGAFPVICLNPDARQYRFLPGPDAHRGQDVLMLGAGLMSTASWPGAAAQFESVETLPPMMVRDTPVGVLLGHHLR